ncbi:hypothetical protein JCM19241_3098 [Vibrio ishigakensis]|uniref:Uncharacterized protein n=1 Tax=Vibrio ishigakensis TaxID=1481914 RepID=A0A0B8QEN9_9VIBR|nr:hypothetical protein JCM19241_3098 [Vibrio ishigakensis]
MSLVKSTLNFTSRVITFGGSTKVEVAKQEYDAAFEQYKPLFETVDKIRQQTDGTLEQIGTRLEKINALLNKVEAVLNQEYQTKSNTQSSTINSSLSSIQNFNTSLNTIQNAGFGTMVGGSTAVGAWALVSTIGSASTGASIAGLSGVAASNATLAWFGGGSLAAGGAGMAGGMAVLGGVVAAPILYFVAKGAHKKANNIAEQTTVLRDEIDKLQTLIPVAKLELEKAQKSAVYIHEISTRYEVTATQLLKDFAINESNKFKWYKTRTWFGPKYDHQERVKLTEILALETEHYLSLLGKS